MVPRQSMERYSSRPKETRSQFMDTPFSRYRLFFILVPFMASMQAISAQEKAPLRQGDSLYVLDIPERPEHALTGSGFVAQASGMNLVDREAAVVREILAGNVPSFSRTLRAVKFNQTVQARAYEVTLFASCDYLAIGSDQDYVYIPLTPSSAQSLAHKLNCSLPTKKMVDEIYTNSEITLVPQPIPPSEKMTTVEVFSQHTDSIKQQLSFSGMNRSGTEIVAGHKKDIIISNRIYDPQKQEERVVIYGWHRSKNEPIQPVYDGHFAMYTDYSHGVRFIARAAFIDGASIQLDDVLKDSVLCRLVSGEGVISRPYYPYNNL